MNRLYEQVAGCLPQEECELCGSASNRRYVRLSGEGGSFIGVEGKDLKENKAFIDLAGHFASEGLPVPRVLAVSGDGYAYLQEDLGDVMLSDLVAEAHGQGSLDSLLPLLQECMRMLARFQFDGGRRLDFGKCYPQPEFDRRMVLFDLNYFKYCMLKPSGLEFDENALQDDFEHFAEDLLKCTDYGNTFLYRDFQSRNVMIREGKPYFIDFQSGRKGPVYYDLASFVWQVRAAYPDNVKEILVETYLEALEEYAARVDRAVFIKELRMFRLLRMLQVLGAYGFRGVIEHKAKFITSLIPALRDLKAFLAEPFTDYPYLNETLSALVDLPQFALADAPGGQLEVKVYSFSYKKGIPEDYTGNGGGYVFDCRSIHNPGRYTQYKNLTGLDEPVIRFLEEDGEILRYMEHVKGVVDPHMETYLRRGFTNLSISFGCTGGQHRSVYCAEHLARHLAGKYPDARIHLIHRERGIDMIL
ncbi:MAG: phosphotransferase [Candidatus Cryptobacteroides sp.]